MHALTQEPTIFDRFVDDRIISFQLLHELLPHLIVEGLGLWLICLVVSLELQVPVQAVSELLTSGCHQK